MYKAKQRVSQGGLYRCTTCGVMIPVDAGETLPTCPCRCPDAIWTFFNEKWYPVPGETRETTVSFSALDLNGEARQVAAGARLTDVSLGPERSGATEGDPGLAAFRCEGQVYFAAAAELLEKTKVVPG